MSSPEIVKSYGQTLAKYIDSRDRNSQEYTQHDRLFDAHKALAKASKEQLKPIEKKLIELTTKPGFSPSAHTIDRQLAKDELHKSCIQDPIASVTVEFNKVIESFSQINHSLTSDQTTALASLKSICEELKQLDNKVETLNKSSSRKSKKSNLSESITEITSLASQSSL